MGDFMQHVNMIKYVFIVAIIFSFWAFIGGIIISVCNNSNFSFNGLGAKVFFAGSIVSLFIFDFIVKKGKISWIFNKKAKQENITKGKGGCK